MEKVGQAPESAGSRSLGLATPVSPFPEPGCHGRGRRGSFPIPPLSLAALLLPYGRQSFLALGILGTDPICTGPSALYQLLLAWLGSAPRFLPVLPGAFTGMVLTVVGIALCVTSSVSKTQGQLSAL